MTWSPLKYPSFQFINSNIYALIHLVGRSSVRFSSSPRCCSILFHLSASRCAPDLRGFQSAAYSCFRSSSARGSPLMAWTTVVIKYDIRVRRCTTRYEQRQEVSRYVLVSTHAASVQRQSFYSVLVGFGLEDHCLDRSWSRSRVYCALVSGSRNQHSFKTAYT